MKVLLAEDDPLIREGLAEILEREGYTVIQCGDGRVAIERFAAEKPDFVCLDIMMPELSGYDVCQRIRSQRPNVPIMLISAKSEEVDRVVGLELGADDYICKPFGVKEVVARIRAITRRCYATAEPAAADPEVFRMDDLDIYPRELRARRGDATIDLSLRDVTILRFLYAHRGAALSRHQIFDACWGETYLASSRTLDQHISQLRKRIEVTPRSPRIIQTVHGVGYRHD